MHNLTNGIIMITSVDEKYLGDYRKAQMGMMEVIAKMQSGEEVYVCGSCTELGACMMKGASQQHVMTSTGDVMLMTADNDELIAELQAWNKRNQEEKKTFDPSKG